MFRMDLEQGVFSYEKGQSQFLQQETPQNQKRNFSPNSTPNVKQYVYNKTKQFWLQKITQAISKNQIHVQDQIIASPPKITQVIRDGLELQDYMQKYTDFFKLYLQQIKPDQLQLNTRKKRFVVLGKMMLRIFLQKNKNAIEYFYDGVDWVEHKLSSYSYLVDQKLCIRTIMEKLVHNKYERQQDFYYDMSKMFDQNLLFNFNNEKMKEIILKLKENWQLIKLKELQLYNFGIQPFLNPKTQMQPETMDINAEINLLKGKVSIWNSKIEELDYDPLYLEKNDLQMDSNLMSRDSQESRKNQTGTRKRGRPKFQSGQKKVETVSRERMLQLKSDLFKRISEEVKSKDKAGMKLMQHIIVKSKKNPHFLGKDNEINLESLTVNEFVQLETFLHNLLNEQ